MRAFVEQGSVAVVAEVRWPGNPVNGILDSFTSVRKPPGPITVRQLLGNTRHALLPRRHSNKRVELYAFPNSMPSGTDGA